MIRATSGREDDVTRVAATVFLSIGMLGAGWTLGRAQTPVPAPEFVLSIDAPSGSTTLRCERGCVLQGGRDEGNPGAATMTEYRYQCSGAERCKARVNGWVKR
jgi:hypothetical protein